MKIIKYEVNDDACITPCSTYPNIKMGNYYCQTCHHFIAINQRTKKVVCISPSISVVEKKEEAPNLCMTCCKVGCIHSKPFTVTCSGYEKGENNFPNICTTCAKGKDCKRKNKTPTDAGSNTCTYHIAKRCGNCELSIAEGKCGYCWGCVENSKWVAK